jgi:hypothetical protein
MLTAQTEATERAYTVTFHGRQKYEEIQKARMAAAAENAKKQAEEKARIAAESAKKQAEEKAHIAAESTKTEAQETARKAEEKARIAAESAKTEAQENARKAEEKARNDEKEAVNKVLAAYDFTDRASALRRTGLGAAGVGAAALAADIGVPLSPCLLAAIGLDVVATLAIFSTVTFADFFTYKGVRYEQKRREQLRWERNCTVNVSKAEWQEDAAAPKCNVCNKSFSWRYRRHHCRKCGDIFCGDCSKESEDLFMRDDHSVCSVRVCTGCSCSP